MIFKPAHYNDISALGNAVLVATEVLHHLGSQGLSSPDQSCRTGSSSCPGSPPAVSASGSPQDLLFLYLASYALRRYVLYRLRSGIDAWTSGMRRRLGCPPSK